MSFKQNAAWLRTHGKEYPGKWVALLDGVLLYSDSSRLELQKQIASNPEIRRIFVAWVIPESEANQHGML